MDNLTKDTKVYCAIYDFFGSIEELKEHVSEQDVDSQDWQVGVKICNQDPFMTVDDNWLIDLISREVEHQGCANERSSDTGDEMEVVEQLLIKHINVDYEAIIAEMPRLFYPEGKEIQIDLNDF